MPGSVYCWHLFIITICFFPGFNALLLPSVQSWFSSLKTLPATKVLCPHKEVSGPGVQVPGAALRQWLTGVEYEKPALLLGLKQFNSGIIHAPEFLCGIRLKYLSLDLSLKSFPVLVSFSSHPAFLLPYLLLLGAFHTESLAHKHSSQSLLLANLTQDNIIALNSHSHSVRIKFLNIYFHDSHL